MKHEIEWNSAPQFSRTKQSFMSLSTKNESDSRDETLREQNYGYCSSNEAMPSRADESIHSFGKFERRSSVIYDWRYSSIIIIIGSSCSTTGQTGVLGSSSAGRLRYSNRNENVTLWWQLWILINASHPLWPADDVGLKWQEVIHANGKALSHLLHTARPVSTYSGCKLVLSIYCIIDLFMYEYAYKHAHRLWRPRLWALQCSIQQHGNIIINDNNVNQADKLALTASDTVSQSNTDATEYLMMIRPECELYVLRQAVT